MSVYNLGRFLRPAINSVLAQTFQDWELIIVDDASTDSTPEILAEYRNPRIRVLRNETNRHVAASLNRAIAEASGLYIANLDADDVFLPNRLAEQVKYLQAHPNVTLVTSAAHLIDENGTRIGFHPGGLSDCSLKFTFARGGNVVMHSSVIFRADAARQSRGYTEDPAFRATTDYELWARLLLEGKACVLSQPLIEYRIHSSSISAVKRDSQESQSDSISRAFAARMLRDDIDDRSWGTWRRFNWSKVSDEVNFDSSEVEVLSVLTLGLLRSIAHDSDGGCSYPWRWSRHALALALGRHGTLSFGARTRFLALAARIAALKLVSH
jgi:glycosyltransferase EpsE